MNDLKVCAWPIENVIPYARNSRKIPERAIDKVAASIQEFGFRVPIVVDQDGVIICGHTRLLAAKKLGLREVPVHVADNLTPAQVKAYRLMDNRSHEETGWDLDLLGPELEELRGLDFDLELTGFDEHEIDDFLADPDDDRADQVPPIPEHPASPARRRVGVGRAPADLRRCHPGRRRREAARHGEAVVDGHRSAVRHLFGHRMARPSRIEWRARSRQTAQ
jgi:ParB-like chromosome segregation protein Spo0J